MTWTRLGDDFADRPDVIALSNDAFAAHVRAFIWCNKHLTDGAVPAGAVRLLIGALDDLDSITAELVAAGVWEATATGFQLDWSEQEPADEVRQRREFQAEKQRRYRDRRGKHDRGDHSDCVPRFCRSVTGNATGNATDDEPGDKPRLVTPTRPDPSRPVPSEGQGQGQGARAGAGAPSSTLQSADADAASPAGPAAPDHVYDPDGDDLGCTRCGLPERNVRHYRDGGTR